MRFQVIIVVTVKNAVFWDVTLFSMEITSISDETAASICNPVLEVSHNMSL